MKSPKAINRDLSRLRKLHEAAAISIMPNENARSFWKASAFAKDECAILAPAYLRRAGRCLLGQIRVDGLTDKEALENSMAVAEFLVAAVNHVIEQLHPGKFCPVCSHPKSEHENGCTVHGCECKEKP